MIKYINHVTRFISAITASVLLTACGGGSDDKKTSAVANEPVQITSSSWKNTQAKSKQETSIKSSIEELGRLTGRYLVKIDVESSSGLNNIKHWQIILNTDNNPKTGFQYEDDAWSKESGIDYIIEDGYLYKSTSNDSNWSWKLVSEQPVTVSYLGGLNLRFSPNLINENGVCKDYKIGFVEFDENWNIDTFFPKANSLLSKKTGYCNRSNTPPTITLKGAENMSIPKGSAFIDPGVTALDKEDGDITSQVKTLYFDSNANRVQSIDTSKAGKYHITYQVSDSLGSNDSAFRYITVTEQNVGIIIDGEKNDWPTNPDINNSNASLWVTDSATHLYFMVESNNLGENTQVFIDSDDDLKTGYHVEVNDSTGAIWRAGADKMIENNYIYSFTGSNDSWEWKWKDIYRGASIIRKGNILEFSVPKALLKNSPTINIGFKSIDDNWNDNYTVFKTNYRLKN
jgi:hypothetical protein